MVQETHSGKNTCNKELNQKLVFSISKAKTHNLDGSVGMCRLDIKGQWDMEVSGGDSHEPAKKRRDQISLILSSEY